MPNNYDFEVKKGATGVPLEVVFKDANGVMPLSAFSTVKVYMRKRGASTNKVDGAACDISDTTNNVCVYAWQAADLDTVGEYDVEFKGTQPDGSVVKLPGTSGHLYGVVRVLESIS